MKPWQHARSSVKKWGGKPEDYLPLHDFFDSTKAAMPDIRHRAVLHNAMGIFILEKVFGPVVTNSDGKQVPTRDIGERHVIEDMGFIPSLEDWLDSMPIEPWHGGIHRMSQEQRQQHLDRKKNDGSRDNADQDQGSTSGGTEGHGRGDGADEGRAG